MLGIKKQFLSWEDFGKVQEWPKGIAWRRSICDEMIAMTIFGTSKNEKVLAVVTDRTATARRTSPGRQISCIRLQSPMSLMKKVMNCVCKVQFSVLRLQLSFKTRNCVFSIKTISYELFSSSHSRHTIKPEMVPWCKFRGTAKQKRV